MGFGNGSFSSWVIENGGVYFGFELIPDLVTWGTDLGLDVFDGHVRFDEVLSAESVDYVVAWDVFEHLSIEEIGSKLCECYTALKSGGRIVARVPSGDSPFSGPLQNGDITHKTSIGSSMVRQLATEHGSMWSVFDHLRFLSLAWGLRLFLGGLWWPPCKEVHTG
jgi:hypothetical protein